MSWAAELEAVLFDLDDTLLDRRGSFDRFLRDQWTRFLPVVQAIDRELYVQTLIELDRDGYGPRKGLFGGLTPRFGLPADQADRLLTDYRASFPRACRLFPDAMPTLSSLRAAGLKLGLITNGSFRMQSGKLQCLALTSAFDTVLISDAEGISKPDVSIFVRALERLEVEPAAAAFVGDNPEVDLAGARAAGMRTIWRRDPKRAGTVEADAVIEQLDDLVALLRGRGLGSQGS
jgi:putative hydrolase of the HAD superfamily